MEEIDGLKYSPSLHRIKALEFKSLKQSNSRKSIPIFHRFEEHNSAQFLGSYRALDREFNLDLPFMFIESLLWMKLDPYYGEVAMLDGSHYSLSSLLVVGNHLKIIVQFFVVFKIPDSETPLLLKITQTGGSECSFDLGSHRFME